MTGPVSLVPHHQLGYAVHRLLFSRYGRDALPQQAQQRPGRRRRRVPLPGQPRLLSESRLQVQGQELQLVKIHDKQVATFVFFLNDPRLKIVRNTSEIEI